MVNGDRSITQHPNADSKAELWATLYACLGLFLGQSTYFIYLPSLPQMSTDFGVSAAMMQNSIAVYALGYGFSQLFWGPVSDQMGRKPVALAGVGIATLSSLALVFSTSFGWFQVLRFIQGVGCGCGTSVSRAALRDVFSSTSLAQRMSYMTFAYAAALGGAPFLGGQLARWFSWRVDFVVLAMLGAILFLTLLSMLPETNLLEKSTRKSVFRLSLVTDYLKILINPLFLLPILACALVTCMIALYEAVSPADFEKTLRFTPAQFGNTSLVMTLAFLLGGILVNRSVRVLGQKLLFRLALLLILSASAVMLALGIAGIFNAYSLLLPMFFVVIGCGIVNPIGFAIGLHPFPAQAGLASALGGLIQQESAGIIIALAALLPNTTQTLLALTLLGGGVVLAGLYKFLRFT